MSLAAKIPAPAITAQYHPQDLSDYNEEAYLKALFEQKRTAVKKKQTIQRQQTQNANRVKKQSTTIVPAPSNQDTKQTPHQRPPIIVNAPTPKQVVIKDAASTSKPPSPIVSAQQKPQATIVPAQQQQRPTIVDLNAKTTVTQPTSQPAAKSTQTQTVIRDQKVPSQKGGIVSAQQPTQTVIANAIKSSRRNNATIKNDTSQRSATPNTTVNSRPQTQPTIRNAISTQPSIRPAPSRKKPIIINQENRQTPSTKIVNASHPSPSSIRSATQPASAPKKTEIRDANDITPQNLLDHTHKKTATLSKQEEKMADTIISKNSINHLDFPLLAQAANRLKLDPKALLLKIFSAENRFQENSTSSLSTSQYLTAIQRELPGFLHSLNQLQQLSNRLLSQGKKVSYNYDFKNRQHVLKVE